MSIQRNGYGEIVFNEQNASAKTACKQILDGVVSSEKIDEHGGWDFGCSFDKKGRGSALNYGVYAYGNDVHCGEFLTVIQVRQYIKASRNGYATIRKSYFLCGKNEDATFFAHPVESRVIHAAIKKDTDVLIAVQSWIFDTDYTKVLRQGDIALVPVKAMKGEATETVTMTLQGSHVLTAQKISQNGSTYALNPHLKHIPNTHPDISGTGKYKVIVGKRTAFWDFAKPTID